MSEIMYIIISNIKEIDMKFALSILFLIIGIVIAKAEPITVITFNAENLFDIEDDPGNPRDDTYLPLEIKKQLVDHDKNCEIYNSRPGFYQEQCKTLDWNAAVYATKLARYADVLKAMEVTPDVVVIPETENKKVLDDLVSQHLTGEGYNVIQLDTSDEPISRGIDVGLITKLELAGEAQAHVIEFSDRYKEDCAKTRDILQVPLRLPDGETLYVFGVHFPSGSNPIECRIIAFKQMNEIVKALPPNSLSVAAGDFNINCKEATTDAFGRMLRRGDWYTSPLITSGCLAPGSSKHVDYLLYNWNTWSFLDMVLVSSELSPSRPSAKNWFADIGSISTVVVNQQQIKVDEKDRGFVEPRRFDPLTGTGVSDHWPVMVRLLNRRKP